MTSDELDEIERIWLEGVPFAEIARTMSYTEIHIRHVASDNRDRLPYRRRSIPRERREEWASRIIAGDATVADAAREFGVTKNAVRLWVRDKRKEEE